MPKCRGCDAEITFAENTATGKKIPLQRVPVYEIDWVEDLASDHNQGKQIALKKESDLYISHFLTCKGANNFSGAKR